MRTSLPTNRTKPIRKKEAVKVVSGKGYLSADELLDRVIPKVEALFDKK